MAPERFQDLSKHTLQSAVHEYGTVMWEMLWRGKDPMECIPAGVNVSCPLQTFCTPPV